MIKLNDYDQLMNLDNVDWQEKVYNLPTKEQPSAMASLLTEALNRFVPTKTFKAHTNDQPWTNAHTRRLLRKKNRNYKLFKKANETYIAAKNNPQSTPETVTKLLNNKQNKFNESRQASNESVKASRNVFPCYK